MNCFEVGDVVRYKYCLHSNADLYPALVLYVNEKGGTLKVLDCTGGIEWYVTSYCEKIA